MKKRDDSYVVFARKWRPQTFEEVVGQDSVKRQLQNALSDGRIANAYLFAGPRGVGKTSVARILSKALNCEKGITPKPCNKCQHCLAITNGSAMDVVEIDGASYTKVENIRDLQEGINRASFSARKKVYIIDEVHMLSINAFNALLKTLEEPPPFVVFIFATTEIEKIPETIKSRCQLYHFERISTEDIIERLSLILSKEKGVKVSAKEKKEILEAIAASAEGGMRDAEVSLDQLISLSGGKLKFEHVCQLLGLVEFDLLLGSIRDIAAQDVKALLSRVNKLVNEGRDLERFVKTFQGFLRDLLILKAGGSTTLTNYSKERLKEIKDFLKGVSLPFLLNVMNNFLSLQERMKTSAQLRFLLEFFLIKLSVIQTGGDIESILEQIEKLPRASAPAPAAPAPPVYPKPSQKSTPVPDLFAKRTQTDKAAIQEDIPAMEMDAPEDLSQLWERFKTSVSSKKHILEDVLGRCMPRELINNTLSIDCPKGYDEKMLATKDSIQKMESVLSAILKKPCKVKLKVFTANQDRGPQPVPTPAAALSPGEADEIQGDDLLDTEEENHQMAEETIMEESRESEDIDVDQYKHLFQDSNVPRKIVLDLLRENPDVKKAVELIKKTFSAKIAAFNGRKIT